MTGATVGLGADNFERSVDVQVEGEISLRLICERQLLDLLGCADLVGHGPVLESQVVLPVHLDLAVYGQHGVNGDRVKV